MQDCYTPKGKHLSLTYRRNVERQLQEGHFVTKTLSVLKFNTIQNYQNSHLFLSHRF